MFKFSIRLFDEFDDLGNDLSGNSQHQGEPVGEVVAFGEGLHEIAWAAGRIPKLGAKLFTHPAPADLGEVERLRVERDTLIRALETADSEVNTLRAQLAEWDVLLIESHDLLNSGYMGSHDAHTRRKASNLRNRIKDLYASAKPGKKKGA